MTIYRPISNWPDQASTETETDGSIGLVIAYGVNSAQNAMMKCRPHPSKSEMARRYSNRRCSRRVEERPPQPPGQDQALSARGGRKALGTLQKRISKDRRLNRSGIDAECFGDCIIDSHTELNGPSGDGLRNAHASFCPTLQSSCTSINLWQ